MRYYPAIQPHNALLLTYQIALHLLPCSFKWYKDTSELNYAHDAVLVVPRASYTDSGQYCCSVSNHHGSQLSRSFNVQVSRVRPKDGECEAPLISYSCRKPSGVPCWAARCWAVHVVMWNAQRGLLFGMRLSIGCLSTVCSSQEMVQQIARG